MPLPNIPLAVNKHLQNAQGQSTAFPFPPNIAAMFPKETRRKIFGWMLQYYIWPQIMQRQPYESQWNRLLDQARASLKVADMRVTEGSRLSDKIKQAKLTGDSTSENADVSDTVIFDAIDRLTNLNHFISFKEQLPVQFNLPQSTIQANENDVYSPSSNLVLAANALLKFSADGSDFYRGHWITARHHYTYGISFVSSEFVYKVGNTTRRQQNGTFAPVPEVEKLGVTFEPISIRKLWLNTTLKPYNMEHQPCPFYFEEIPRFAIVANAYDPTTNPFGYVNLQALPQAQFLFQGQEMDSYLEAFQKLNPKASLTPTSLCDPKYAVELKWVLYPMLPITKLPLQNLPPETLQQLQRDWKNEPGGQEMLAQIEQQGFVYDFDSDGKKGYPTQRFICEMFGNSMVTGSCEFIRLQENFYPRNEIPIYGSSHMPDLDSGLYSPAIGTILDSHYVQICKALNQWLDNKDLLNDPPIKIQQNSPAVTQKLTKPGQKNLVNSIQDYEEHSITDHTGTTPAFLDATRNQAQTSSKAVDAILGKAMGSRTSATEASNVFQTAMSGVTTDINLFNHDISGGYAMRVWDYFGVGWVDPDLIKTLTGQFGFMLTPEHFQIRLGLSWDVGSTYIESVTKQGNLRYLLESTVGDPSVNRAELLRELMREWRMKNVDLIVNDQGLEEEIQLSNQQACETYMGELVMVDPDQNHAIAIKVKKSYLKDRDSVWNTRPEFAAGGQLLVRQIQMHAVYMQMQLLQKQAQVQLEEAIPEDQGGGESQRKPTSPPSEKARSAKQTSQT